MADMKTDRILRRTEASQKILTMLIQAEGLSQVIRFIQYAAEETAKDLIKAPYPEELRAPAYIKAAEILEEPYEQIKNELKL